MKLLIILSNFSKAIFNMSHVNIYLIISLYSQFRSFIYSIIIFPITLCLFYLNVVYGLPTSFIEIMGNFPLQSAFLFVWRLRSIFYCHIIRIISFIDYLFLYFYLFVLIGYRACFISINKTAFIIAYILFRTKLALIYLVNSFPDFSNIKRFYFPMEDPLGPQLGNKKSFNLIKRFISTNGGARAGPGSGKKSFPRKYWEIYTCNNNPIITPEVLDLELKKFFVYLKGSTNIKFFAFLWQIKFPNGAVRSCSTAQLASVDDYSSLFNTLKFIYTTDDLWLDLSEPADREESFVDNNTPIGNIIFNYKLVKKIRNTKYEKYLVLDNKLLLREESATDYINLVEKPFKFNEYSIPKTMDLSIWPNIVFFNDYKNAHAIFEINLGKEDYYVIDYNFTLLDYSYDVTVSNRGTMLFRFRDESANMCKDLTQFKRTIWDKKDQNKIYYFDSGKIPYYSSKINVAFIQPKAKQLLTKLKIITLDLESRRENNRMIPVCMCIFDGTNKYDFILGKNWKKDLANGLRSIMRRKYDNYRIYVHNLSYFDIIFLLDTLSTLGDIDPIMRNERILKLKFTFTTGGKRKCTLHFHDSFLLLQDSQDKLSKSFDVKNKKSKFPLKFLNESDYNINYIGPIPEYKHFGYYKNFSLEDYKIYCNSFKTNNWNLREELINYCYNDVEGLHQILTKFIINTYKSFEVDAQIYPTTSSLALGMYRVNDMPKNKIPKILGKHHYNLKKSFFGGITETYKGLGRNINSYDVNSLYPFSMKIFPMPTGKPTHFIGNVFDYDKDPFGFFKVKVYAPHDLNKPILPHRIKSKSGGVRTIYPVGNWEGWYFSEEIMNAKKNFNYKFEIQEGYLFEKSYIFGDYIDRLYKIKCELDSSDPLYYIAKLFMNGLYGRFGLNPEARKVEITTTERSLEVIEKEKFVDITPFPSGKVMVSYESEKAELDITNISVVISSAIAAYSRVHMSHFMKKYNDSIHYIDTDGIKLASKLSPEEIDNKKLGKMKYEYTFTEAVFPAPKVYGGILANKYKSYGKELVKVKGLKNPVPYSWLKSIINKNTKIIIEQEKWKRVLEESTIVVTNTPYTLSLTENKRSYIFDSLGNYITSKPLVLENGVLLENQHEILYYLPEPKVRHIYIPMKIYIYIPKKVLLLPKTREVLTLPKKVVVLPKPKKILLLSEANKPLIYKTNNILFIPKNKYSYI